jgi:phosphohistidine phosphatase
MDLILLRHGKAEDSHTEGDFSRNLLEKGREQARRAARLLQSGGILPQIVLTSPLIRARQTAEEFCQTAKMPGALVQGWLNSGMSPETALRELVAFPEFSRVAIVGHEPDFSQLLQWILGTSGGMIQVKKGAIACVRISPPARHGILRYLIPPKLADELED